MSNEAFEHLVTVTPENGEDDQGITIPLNNLKLSNPTALSSIPCISPPTKPVDMVEHARDSGYASVNTTPDHNKDATIASRKPGQETFIRQTGLCISNKTMEPGTKQRFVEVQLQIEKMLLELMRKLKSGPGRYKPIAIRPMMLGKTEADADAKPYMVIICSDNIKRKVQDFFGDPLIKSLCDPRDDSVPPFKVLVVGHALRLRASTSDITVQCDAVKGVHDGTRTFCGMPIRLCDEVGHSRIATFGGIVKVTSTSGEYQLYGLTAGHMFRDHQFVTDEDDSSLYDLDPSDLVDLIVSERVMEAPEDQTTMASPKTSNSIDQDAPVNWRFSDKHKLGKLLDTDERKDLAGEGETQMKPRLDWALFELNVHKPNRIAFHSQNNSRGDLGLPLPTTDHDKDEIYVSMLCASQGAKHGVLSTTRARVLLEGADSFTDAYTLSLEGSEGKSRWPQLEQNVNTNTNPFNQVSDGDSGSWVVDDLRLEVYGHVIADDFFGDVYVIPMNDILADIQRYLGARSVELPSGLDIISTASLKQPDLFAGAPSNGLFSQTAAGNPEDTSHTSSTEGRPFMLSAEERAAGSLASAESVHQQLATSSSINLRHRAVSVPPIDIVILYPENMMRPQTPHLANPSTPVSVEWPHVTDDSGYSSLNATPNTSPPPQTVLSGLKDEDSCKAFDTRLLSALEAADRHTWEQLTEDELVEALWSPSGHSFSLSDLRSLPYVLLMGKDKWFQFKELSHFS